MDKYIKSMLKNFKMVEPPKGLLKRVLLAIKKEQEKTKIFYNGTNKFGLKETKKQGYLLHKRIVLDENGKQSKIFKPNPCTWLTPNIKDAKHYGDVILEVKYNPFQNPDMNNYSKNIWQFRVYEPIYNYKIIK